MKQILVFLIRIYKKFYKNFLKFYFPSQCRFYPSCSDYAIEAIRGRGVLKGSFLSVKRIIRCNPYSKGGIDILD